MAICILCEEHELSPRAQLKTCRTCRSSMGMWGRRPAADVLRRRQKLHIYDVRMEMVVLNPKNVTKAEPIVKPFESARDVKRRLAQRNGVRKNGG
jgi:hypothetical protein